MGFKLDLAAAATDQALHFNTTTKLAFAGYEVRATRIEDPAKGTMHWQDLSWDTTEPLTDISGVEHPAGTTLHQQRSFFENDVESRKNAAKDAAYAVIALTGKRPQPGFNFEKEQDDLMGKVVASVISYKPSTKPGKEGFDNFRHTSTPQPAAAPAAE